MKTVQMLLKKLKLELPYNPAIPLLGSYGKKMKTLIWKAVCALLLIAASFIKKQPVPLNIWMYKEMWYLYTVQYYQP